jgi:hypothetical protein
MGKKCPSHTRGTLQYFKYTTWNSINKRTVNGSSPSNNTSCLRYLKKGIELRMTKQEYYVWCDRNASRILGIYKRGGTPTVDRTRKHYSIDSIRVSEFSANSIAGAVKGALTTKKTLSKPVIAINCSTGKSRRFSSAADARRFGFDQANILKCLRGKARTHKGYRWCYA